MFAKECQAIPKIYLVFLVIKFSEIEQTLKRSVVDNLEILRFRSDCRARSQIDQMPGSQKCL